MTLAFCTCVKDEGPYLHEWLDFHREQGVDTFIVYDNESSDETVDLLHQQSDVVYYSWPGRGVQIEAETHAIKHRCDWMAFIDADEFLYSPIKAKLPDVLKLYEQSDIGAVVAHWMLYGLTEDTDITNPVTERCTMRDQRPSRYVKTICRPNMITGFHNCHRVITRPGCYSVNENGERLLDNNMPECPTADILRLNHYAMKSEKEFALKLNKWQADTGEPKREEWYRSVHDKRIVEDKSYPYRWGRNYRLKFSEEMSITNKPAGRSSAPPALTDNGT